MNHKLTACSCDGAMEDNSIADQISLAQTAEQAERYDDMVETMKNVVYKVKEHGLTDLQRNLLSVAYKNLVGARRTAWRTISAIIAKPTDNETTQRLAIEYQEKIVKELKNICDDVLVRCTIV